ncbi:MAG: hypothetical protein V1719_02320 [Patescibacteria group bacterium]
MQDIPLSELFHLAFSQVVRDCYGNYQCRLNPNAILWHKRIYEISKTCPDLFPLNRVTFEKIISSTIEETILSQEVAMACDVLCAAGLLRIQIYYDQDVYFVFHWRDRYSDWLEHRKAEIFAGDPVAGWQFEGLVSALARALII